MVNSFSQKYVWEKKEREREKEKNIWDRKEECEFWLGYWWDTDHMHGILRWPRKCEKKGYGEKGSKMYTKAGRSTPVVQSSRKTYTHVHIRRTQTHGYTNDLMVSAQFVSVDAFLTIVLMDGGSSWDRARSKRKHRHARTHARALTTKRFFIHLFDAFVSSSCRPSFSQSPWKMMLSR